MTKNSIKMTYENGKWTATITKDFDKKSKVYGSLEFNELNKIIELHPNIIITVKENDKNKPQKITYDKMSEYINLLENRKTLLAEFEIIKKRSKIEKSPYKFVSDWFNNNIKNNKELEFIKPETSDTETSDTETSDNITKLDVSNF